VPLRSQRVLTVGVLLWFQALAELLDDSLRRLVDGENVALREKARRLDAAYAALEATAKPLRSTTFGRNSAQLTDIASISAAARNYARSLAVEAEAAGAIPSPALRAAARQLRACTVSIEERIETGEHRTYVRSASLLELASRSVPPGNNPAHLALRDLTLLDGALARLATALQMEVRDLDTTEEPVSASLAEPSHG